MQRFDLKSCLLAVVAVAAAVAAQAHHSFAVFFDDSRVIKIQGTVTDFQFRNPHGIIRMTVRDAQGAEQVWKAETNSPSILERRGWTRDSIKNGDVVIVEGWPSRDGSNYMRMRKVSRTDGTPVGVPFETGEQK
ncbi:MAG TPA: DUF6152 family protein [Steroidobacteraceae bacterium]|nr:DUF6152 family protein [Steroidobacteraceae bacterium]